MAFLIYGQWHLKVIMSKWNLFSWSCCSCRIPIFISHFYFSIHIFYPPPRLFISFLEICSESCEFTPPLPSSLLVQAPVIVWPYLSHYAGYFFSITNRPILCTLLCYMPPMVDLSCLHHPWRLADWSPLHSGTGSTRWRSVRCNMGEVRRIFLLCIACFGAITRALALSS